MRNPRNTPINLFMAFLNDAYFINLRRIMTMGELENPPPPTVRTGVNVAV